MRPENDLNALVENLQRLNDLSAGSEPRPTGNQSAEEAVSGRDDPVLQIIRALGDFAGFRYSDSLYRKLQRVFRNRDPEELRRWLYHTPREQFREELIALTEDLTNHETYFFRDSAQLRCLSAELLPELIARRRAERDPVIRIWSAATSTGEETYTLAMLALEALREQKEAEEPRPGEIRPAGGWRVQVLGTDISRQALRIAREGVYERGGLGGLRNYPPRYQRFLEPAAGASSQFFKPVACVRDCVQFEQFNMMGFRPPRTGFDLVLCRNFFIYMDPDSHRQIQQTIARGMRQKGALVMSPVDRMQAPEQFRERHIGRTAVHEYCGGQR